MKLNIHSEILLANMKRRRKTTNTSDKNNNNIDNNDIATDTISVK